ncbi:MAG: helix-turn-helix domain-containing protein [Candidatus Atribacteria bacterium]|nr:helix-turn-helix domain-containing protein [Candidatus Atribacteria bacterium]
MTIQAQVNLRSRKLGVLIRDARLAARRTIPECARTIGVTAGIFRAWEEGRRSPSLPELEVLSYALNLPLRRFWSKDATSDDASPTKALNLPAFVGIRQRLIGALLRQMREKASISPRALSGLSGISTAHLKAYELGERPIPLPELEGLTALLGGQIELLFDQTGHIGLWMVQQRAIQDFLQLSPELQNFVCKPVNRPYLELAMKLSGMSTDKLRSVAEDLLDITF